jgi:hypothetical protein
LNRNLSNFIAKSIQVSPKKSALVWKIVFPLCRLERSDRRKLAMPEESSKKEEAKKDGAKSDVSQQVTDWILKFIMAGGSLGAGWALFKESDLPKALISGLLAIGAGYVTTLMKPVHEGNETRLKKFGKKLDKKTDEWIDTTWGNLSGFERQYLEALKVNCYALKIEGFKGYLPALALEEVFVPLRIVTDPAQRNPNSFKKEIWDLLPTSSANAESIQGSRYRRIAVIADPGFGKTTLTRHLTLSYANGSFQSHKVQALLPVLLLLRDIHPQILTNEKPALPDLIVEQVKRLPRCKDLDISSQWFKGRLQQGKCLVMLDGLDEVPETQREKVSRWINWQMKDYPSVFILTSRPHGYDSSLFEGVQPVEIQPFNREEKSDFIHKWYRARMRESWDELLQRNQAQPEAKRLPQEQVEAQSEDEAEKAATDLINQLAQNPAINELASNPLLVTIVATLHETFESLPNQRVKFYQKIFSLLLEDRPKRRETKLTLATAEDNQAVLEVVASKLLDMNTTQFTLKQGAEWIREKLVRLNADPKLTPKKFFWEIQHIAGLLAGGESDLYQFSHKTFQEYLAAVALKEQEPRIIEQLHNPNWEEVVCFFAALTNANGLVKAVLGSPPGQRERALRLAHRMVVEEKSKTDPEIRQQLEQALAEVQFAGELGAKVRLEERFRNLIRIDERTEIDPTLITWDEYDLFISDQNDRKFHSQANPGFVLHSDQFQCVRGISWQDAQWFCAWLMAQPELQAEEGVYDYRLPTEEELRSPLAPLEKGETGQIKAPLEEGGGVDLIPFTHSPDSQGNVIRVVRTRLPERYKVLVNYLANGRWKEADQETDRIMLEVAGRTEQGYLDPDDIKDFPCEDLLTIDQLWVKFSGGRFGFSVQKQIWIECGRPMDYNDAWETFGDRVGWRKDGDWLQYNNLILDLNAPRGEFPCVVGVGVGELSSRWQLLGWVCGALFSRAETCRV